MDNLVDAADFEPMIDQRPGIKISTPEEAAYKTAGSIGTRCWKAQNVMAKAPMDIFRTR